jgi:hypothetical protein
VLYGYTAGRYGTPLEDACYSPIRYDTPPGGGVLHPYKIWYTRGRSGTPLEEACYTPVRHGTHWRMRATPL